MSYWEEDGTALKMWDWSWFTMGSGDPCRVRAVPGGWGVENHVTGESFAYHVPDPTAPHCQPTPATDDRPPMTDDELEQWLTATYGEPVRANETRADGVPYKATHWFQYFGDGEDDFNEVATRIRDDWQLYHGSTWLPAHIIGPALWAAHRYGVKS